MLPVLVLVCHLLSTAFPSVAAADGVTHALLINGGSKPAVNFQSHLHHLQDMVDTLALRGILRERIHLFSADGQDASSDLAVRDTLPAQFWLIDGTGVGKQLKPKVELTNTRWEGMALQPATKAVLKKWFASAEERLKAGDQLLIFVTDHGTGNTEDPDNGAISLWEEEIEVREFGELLAMLPPGVQTVMVMSQCYSGTFAAAIDGAGAAEPEGTTCGFFSTTRDLRAYGCYPEGRDRDRLGHAFRFINALGRQDGPDDAHREVLVTDDSPDVPIRTSDVYLDRIVAEEAKSRRVEVDDLVDRLLSVAWRVRGAWEREIRLLDGIGAAFGTFSPRSLAELDAYARDLPPLIEQMKTFARRWKTALISVKEENLAAFTKANPSWESRLENDALKKLDAAARKALLAELLPRLEAHTHDRPDLSGRLERLRDNATRAAKAQWRLETRKGALQRMRTILITMAGRVLLRGEGPSAEQYMAQRGALQALTACEASAPGVLPPERLAAEAPAVAPYPPLADELRLLEEVLPSYLGVRFRKVPEGARNGRRLPDGASWIDAVFPDSPAMEAGLQVGDILLGPPEHSFTAPGQLREWTMTSPRQAPLALRVLRPADDPDKDRSFEAKLLLRPLPLKWPELPGPPKVGDSAPPLPPGLVPVGPDKIPELGESAYVLFFWATWCQPCELAVPEVMAFAKERELTVLAISDEEPATVVAHVKAKKEGFFNKVAIDGLRKSFITYGVSGTPTMILVDQEGTVRHRQVGYRPAEGLTVDGWQWSKP
jgi:thiol-disulfide isomerase/thioredoxin